MYKLLEIPLQGIIWFDVDGDEKERSWARIIEQALLNLPRHLSSFDYSVLLHINSTNFEAQAIEKENTDHVKYFRECDLMAFRNGARTFHVIQEDLQAIRDAFDALSPKYLSEANAEQARQRAKDYRKQFQQGIGCRNVASHTTELHATPSKAKHNSLSGENTVHGIHIGAGSKNIQIVEGTRGDVYFGSYKTKPYEYQLNQTTSNELKAWLVSYFSWIRPILADADNPRR